MSRTILKLRKKPIRKMTADELWCYHVRLNEYLNLIASIISKVKEEEWCRRQPDL